MRPTIVCSYFRDKSGFFSCCSLRLTSIVDYINEWKVIPDTVDSSNSFAWYKPAGHPEDVTYEYFTDNCDPIQLPKIPISFHHTHQFSDFRTLDFKGLMPLINKYFTVSPDIERRIEYLEEKYIIKDYSNLCTLFYRGNDKATETYLPTYRDYLILANKIKKETPEIQFLIQSDETEFIELMTRAFPSSIVCKDEIRHIAKQNSTVDIVFADQNAEFSKWYLAITVIMSKTQTIICGDGNCSLWIALYRGSTEGMILYNGGRWVHG